YNLSGTAINGTDYSALTGSVTIPAGLSYATIAVTALPDNLIEPDETVVITGAITAGFTWGSNNVATVSIKDATGNDPAKKVLSISPLIANVAEGESTTIKISLPEGITVTSPMDINYKVLGTAINGTDYVTLTGTATIPAGSGTAIIEVNALTDNLLESDETIIITGVATAGFTWSAIANTAMVTITDVTDPANKVLRFSPTTAAVAEGSSASIKVSLPEGIITTKDITFSYGVSGTATSVYDYTSLTGTGTILAGNNSLDIVVTALMDSIIEGDETVILTGSSIQGGSLTGFSWDDAAKEATVTITDVTDSAEKVLNFSPTTA
ncbi:hypothetical protein IUY40_19145, partial [Flavobacterium sp. ALJ2]|uniref:Calx-beta domain-containing protein n=1 Tax=Flavobacterium sp. ALJ2 TaxID=2786960 RepID=UPI001E514944